MPRGLVIASVLSLAAVAAPASADEPDLVPWLGINFQPENDGSLTVLEVYPGTGAALAGMLPGDTISQVEGQTLASCFPPGMAPSLSCDDHLRQLVRFKGNERRPIGDRIRITVGRDGRPLELVAPLSAYPTPGELLEVRLLGASLPRMQLVDRHDVPLRLDGQPALLVVFDSMCERCGGAASAMVAAAAEQDPATVVRTIVVGDKDEVDSYLSRNPVTGVALRWDAGRERPRATSVLSGLTDRTDGAVLVVDAAGVVRFAASTTDVEQRPSVRAGALAAATRVRERPRRVVLR